VTAAVFIAALTSALLHACWNMIAKVHGAPRDVLFGIAMATATVCAAAFPFVGPPVMDTWPWIVAASVCNIVYLRVLSEAYTHCGFGIVYALVRTFVPPILFVMGWLFLMESGGPGAVSGLILVAVSLLVFAAAKGDRPRLDRRTLLLSGLAGLVLAVALLLDVMGIRAGGGGLAGLLRYAVASSITTAAGLALVSLLQRKSPFASVVSNPALCYAGAALLLLSYFSGMWAYAQGPIGLVAPLRESGILFGGALAVLVLRERVTELQWTAMGLATIGVVLVKIG